MENEQPTSKEVITREYPKTTYWLEGKLVRAVGNLILTNKRLLFLRQVVLSTEQTKSLQKILQKGDTSELLQFALRLHKKNFQVPLSSIISAKMKLLSFFPIRPYMVVSYYGASKNIKTQSFMFVPPMLKRILMSEFPTIGWVGTINKTVKKAKKSITVN